MAGIEIEALTVKSVEVEQVKLVPAHSSTRALKIIGDMWVLRILWSAFRGAKRFSDWSDVGKMPSGITSCGSSRK